MTGTPAPRARRAALEACLLGATVLIGGVDFRTGKDLSLSLLYLVPVAAAALAVGATGAVAAAVVAGSSSLIADVAFGGDVRVSVWNAFTRTAIFVATGLLVARVRADRSRMTGLLEREKELARTDPLTGLSNSRGFLERLMTEASRSRRAGRPLCMAYVDIDDFKGVNDRYGHSAGDLLLQRIARAIRETIRAGDVPGRLGGDEFAILFHEVDREGVENVAHRVIERIRQAGSDHPEAPIGASVGVAWFDTPPDSVEEILGRADRTMYHAKADGKGRLAVWSGPGGGPPVRPASAAAKARG